MHYIISVWNGKFFIWKQILVKLLESKHVFLLQTTDKEAPGLVRMHTMAYLSGFPGSLKETEQLRVKLPAVVTSKIKQVKLFNRVQCNVRNDHKVAHKIVKIIRNSWLSVWVLQRTLRPLSINNPSDVTVFVILNFFWLSNCLTAEHPLIYKIIISVLCVVVFSVYLIC